MPNTPSTEVAIAAGQGAIKKSNATAADVIAAMYAAELQAVTDLFTPSAAVPKAVVVTAEQQEAITAFLERVELTEFPDKIRKLEPVELVDYMDLRLMSDEVEAVVESAKTSVRDAVMNHFDVVAVDEGRVDESTYLTKDLHYVTRERDAAAVPGQEKKFVRTVRRGKVTFGTQVELDDYVLDLYERKVIDRKTYLRWTRQVRIVDTEKMFEDMKDPNLMGIIRQATRVTKPTAALEIANNNGDEGD